MADSLTLICARALGYLGIAAVPTDPLTDTGPEAAAFRLYYGQTRDLMLSSFPWSFTRRRVALTDLGVSGTQWSDHWSYRYKLPTDVLKIRRILNPGTRTEGQEDLVPFEVADTGDGSGQVILCDSPDAVLEYTGRVEDPALFPILFSNALSLLLAANMGASLRVDAKLVQLTAQRATQAINLAAGQDLQGRQPDPRPASSFERSRG